MCAARQMFPTAGGFQRDAQCSRAALNHSSLFSFRTLQFICGGKHWESCRRSYLVVFVLFTSSLFPDQRGKVSQKSYLHASLHLELFHYFSDYSAFSGKRKMPKTFSLVGRWSSSWSSACHVFSGCVFLIIVMKPSVGAYDDPVCCGFCSVLALVHMLFLSLCRVHMSYFLIILLCFVFL